MQKVSLTGKLSQFSEHWKPHIIGELNGQHVKVTKLRGEFIWHHHDREDELFLVVTGRLRMDYREDGEEKSIEIDPGEFVIVPRGMEHRPCAEEETAIVLFEPAGTLNTGNVQSERTVEAVPL